MKIEKKNANLQQTAYSDEEYKPVLVCELTIKYLQFIKLKQLTTKVTLQYCTGLPVIT